MRAQEQPEVVEKIIRKLRAGMMPPAGARRPDAATIDPLTAALESRMDEHAATNPNPGWRPFQRLNRAEYTRAVRDLLGIEVDVTAFLPADTMSHGFDNVADVQGMSPTLLEGYMRAASQISRLAVGDRDATPAAATYKVGRTMSQMRHVEGAPMGTRGGIVVTHIFPADGDYVIGVNLHNEPLGGLYGRSTMSVMNIKEEIDVAIDGERVAVIPLNERMSESDPANSLDPKTARIHVKAGPHRRVGGVHPEVRGADRRPARAGREHAGRRQHELRRHAAAAPARHDGERPLRRDRRVRLGEPPPHLHLPADLGGRGADLRRRDRQADGDAGLPRPGAAGRSRDVDGVLHRRAHGRATSSTPSATRSRRSSPARASCSASRRCRRRCAPGSPSA